MPKLRNGSMGDSNPGSLDCESGILTLSHLTPNRNNLSGKLVNYVRLTNI